jgi:hypothetical protein
MAGRAGQELALLPLATRVSSGGHPGPMGQTMTARAVRPARFWYLVAGVVLAGSVVWLVLWMLLGLRSLDREVDGFQRVPVPGEATVSFARPGGYVLYFEYWDGEKWTAHVSDGGTQSGDPP